MVLFNKRKKVSFLYVLEMISIVLGLVLVWRGIWNLLDTLDVIFFDGHNLWTSVAGIVLGFLMLYLPDKDLKELEGH